MDARLAVKKHVGAGRLACIALLCAATAMGRHARMWRSSTNGVPEIGGEEDIVFFLLKVSGTKTFKIIA